MEVKLKHSTAQHSTAQRFNFCSGVARFWWEEKGWAQPDSVIPVGRLALFKSVSPVATMDHNRSPRFCDAGEGLPECEIDDDIIR
ncbi:Uncharacterized protein TCM_010127 [Theobroma cacao]|uniref:Uncharacterized protein n=1 Tax=Theobroma cacao TaxID=3641 RepID=A0A061E6N8_THECC|nr:Uncharacterized protein TCM_010127 [Theobroma cacao]